MSVDQLLERVGKCEDPCGTDVMICLNGEEYIPARKAYFAEDDHGERVLVVDNREEVL